jgi:hypothetical protein
MEHAAGVSNAIDHFGKGFIVGNGQNFGFTADVAQDEDQKQHQHLGKDGENVSEHSFHAFCVVSFILPFPDGKNNPQRKDRRTKMFGAAVCCLNMECGGYAHSFSMALITEIKAAFVESAQSR